MDTETAKRAIVRVRIEHDPDAESPLEYDQFRLVGFLREYTHYEPPSNYTGERGLIRADLRRRLKAGGAFLLRYTEHGPPHKWDLAGSITPGRDEPLDEYDGILFWDGKMKDLRETAELRRETAQAAIDEYTEWSNGHTYWFSIERLTPPERGPDEEPFDPDLDDLEECEAEDVESCGGFIGEDHIVEEIRGILKSHGLADARLIVEGDCAWIADYHDLQPSA